MARRFTLLATSLVAIALVAACTNTPVAKTATSPPTTQSQAIPPTSPKSTAPTSRPPTQAGPQLLGIAAGSDLTELGSKALNERLSYIHDTLHASIVRWDVSWRYVEPTRGQYDWAVWDTVATAITRHGLKSQIIVGYAPSWAAADGLNCQTSDLCGPTPDHVNDYAAFVTTAVKRLDPDRLEYWNEPNIGFFFQPKPNPDIYTHMVVASDAALGAAGQKPYTITGGTADSATDGTNYGPLDWAKAVYATGIAGHFDGYGVHPYLFKASPVGSPATDAWGAMAATHEIMAKYGDGQRSMEVTEFGYPTGDSTPSSSFVSTTQQSRYLADTMKLWFGQGHPAWYGSLLWYADTDSGPSRYNPEQHFGLRTASHQAKPAAAVYAREALKH